MTHATKAIYRWMLSDYIKVSNISTEQMLYTEADLEASMEKIETINFHEERDVMGVRFWAYNAGHVLGAAMFMIEIAGVKILYTGDFSRQEDRHLMAAEIPSMKPDVLITESTYGTHIHEKREDRESRFTALVQKIVQQGGRCLIPVFALGRAQELLLILDEYWSQNPELQEIPIYYASSLAKKCMAVYQTYINAMNDKIRRQIAVNNPFVFRHISNLKVRYPCIIFKIKIGLNNIMSFSYITFIHVGHRPLRRRWSMCYNGLPRYDAKRPLTRAFRNMVHRTKERCYHCRILRGGHFSQNHSFRT